MAHATHFTNGTEIDSYLATAYAEGFCEGEGASSEDQLAAWSYLVGTNLCFSLQGWFGRTARDLIERGLLDEDGTVLFDEFEN